MTVIRRLDPLLEVSKPKVLNLKAQLKQVEVPGIWPALCAVTGYAFCNALPFVLK